MKLTTMPAKPQAKKNRRSTNALLVGAGGGRMPTPEHWKLYAAGGRAESASAGAHPNPNARSLPAGSLMGDGGGMTGARGFGGLPDSMRQEITLLSKHCATVGAHAVRSRGVDVAKNQLVNWLNDYVTMLEDPKIRKNSETAYQVALDALRSGDKRKMLALCELRKEAINNYIRSRSHFLEMYFQEEVLGQSDSAYIRNETQYEQAVYYMAQDGNLKLQRAIAAYTNSLIPLYFVASQKYGYQIEDIQRGNVTAPAMASVDIGFDIAQQLDHYAYLLLTGQLPRASLNNGANGVIGAFTTKTTNPTLPSQLWTYNAHSAIQTALLPTTNQLFPVFDPTPAGLTAVNAAGNKGVFWKDPGGNPVIGLNALHAAIKYADAWGNVFRDGALRPTGLVLVPACDASSTLTQVQATAAKPSAIAEGLLSNYTRVEYGNIVWTFMPDNTIPQGTMFIVFNKPVGKNFVKPSFDREFVNTDFENNWEDRWYRKTQGLYVPVQWTPHVATVQYM